MSSVSAPGQTLPIRHCFEIHRRPLRLGLQTSDTFLHDRGRFRHDWRVPWSISRRMTWNDHLRGQRFFVCHLLLKGPCSSPTPPRMIPCLASNLPRRHWFFWVFRLVYLAAFDGFWVVNVINNDGEKGCLNQCIRMEETPRKRQENMGRCRVFWSSNIARKKGQSQQIVRNGPCFFLGKQEIWGSVQYALQYQHFIVFSVYTVHHVICTCYIKFNGVAEVHVPAIFVAGQCIQLTNRWPKSFIIVVIHIHSYPAHW